MTLSDISIDYLKHLSLTNAQNAKNMVTFYNDGQNLTKWNIFIHVLLITSVLLLLSFYLHVSYLIQ